MRRILLVGLAASLVLAGCGSSDGGGGTLADVEVTKGDVPKVTVEKGFEADETETRVVLPGDGAEITESDSVKVNIVAVNGTTGKEFDNSFASDQPLTINLAGQTLEGFRKGLLGQKVGSRVLVAIPPADGFRDQGQASFGVEAEDTMVFLFDVVSVVPTQAEGDAKDLPGKLPRLTLDDDDRPAAFEKTDDTSGAPKKAQRHVVVQGGGAEVQEGQTLNVQYLGQVYPDGTIFDSSWERGAPATFGLGQVIPCWQDQLPGVKIGSRVVLVCPPDDAYGDTGTPDGKVKPGDTLLFAIDVLDAS